MPKISAVPASVKFTLLVSSRTKFSLFSLCRYSVILTKSQNIFLLAKLAFVIIFTNPILLVTLQYKYRHCES